MLNVRRHPVPLGDEVVNLRRLRPEVRPPHVHRSVEYKEVR